MNSKKLADRCFKRCKIQMRTTVFEKRTNSQLILPGIVFNKCIVRINIPNIFCFPFFDFFVSIRRRSVLQETRNPQYGRTGKSIYLNCVTLFFCIPWGMPIYTYIYSLQVQLFKGSINIRNANALLFVSSFSSCEILY